MRFEGKTVAITGGGGGIGSALVRRFAGEGEPDRRGAPFHRGGSEEGDAVDGFQTIP